MMNTNGTATTTRKQIKNDSITTDSESWEEEEEEEEDDEYEDINISEKNFLFNMNSNNNNNNSNNNNNEEYGKKDDDSNTNGKSLKSIKAILDMSEDDIKKTHMEKKLCFQPDTTMTNNLEQQQQKQQQQQILQESEDNMKELFREIFTSPEVDEEEEYSASTDDSSSSNSNSSSEDETPNESKALLEVGEEHLIKSVTFSKSISARSNNSGSDSKYLLTSPLGQRIQERHQEQQQQKMLVPTSSINTTSSSSLLKGGLDKINIPKDFLRIPESHAVRLANPKIRGDTEWRLINQLENSVCEEIAMLGLAEKKEDVFSRVVIRDVKIGLGMTIHEHNGNIQIHALVCQDATRVHYSPSDTELDIATRTGNAGPAQLAGIRPSDRIVGVNGQALSNMTTIASKLSASTSSVNNDNLSVEMLKNAVRMIMNTPDPVVLHLKRVKVKEEENQSLHMSTRSINTMTTLMTVPDLLDSEYVEPNNTHVDNNNGTYNNNNYSSPNKEIPHENIQFEKEVSIPLTNSVVLSSKKTNSLVIHPLAKAFTARSIIRTPKDESIVTIQFSQFTERAEQWESTSFLRFDPVTKALNPIYDKSDLPYSDTPYKIPKLSAPSTPSPSFSRLDSIQYYNTGSRSRLSNNISTTDNNTTTSAQQQDVFLSLGHVRKAICIRIMHSFQDGDRTAYTIWVYDVESGKEWYAPVRYYRDFQDLRNATCRIYPFLSQIPFPSSSHWGAFWTSASSNSNKEDAAANIISSPTLKLLEIFLRSLCAMLYTGTLHPRSAEVAIHLQSFLGCDVCFSKEEDTGQPFEDVFLQNQVILPKPISHRFTPKEDVTRDTVKLHLKRSVQRYIHRVFLLPVVDQLTTKFIDDYKCTASTNFSTSISSSSASSNISNNISNNAPDKKNGNNNNNNSKQQKEFKVAAQGALDNVRNFLDQMQDLLWEGCKEDLLLLSKRREFELIQDELDHVKSGCYRETWIQEGIREQIEIEIYVPLRSAISRLLVYGWRHDDLEMQFKVQELKKRSQNFFRIQKDLQSPTDWNVCCKMLSEGVGRSTLPCEKLRAIVATAHEIARLSLQEQSMKQSYKNVNKSLCADDFLPIFIYCFVQAEMLRPCALCVLLLTVCDPQKKIGETGYYLASFESAVSYIHEFDLMEECSVNSIETASTSFLSFS